MYLVLVLGMGMQGEGGRSPPEFAHRMSPSLSNRLDAVGGVFLVLHLAPNIHALSQRLTPMLAHLLTTVTLARW
jgi:hypothetical protein